MRERFAQIHSETLLILEEETCADDFFKWIQLLFDVTLSEGDDWLWLPVWFVKVDTGQIDKRALEIQKFIVFGVWCFFGFFWSTMRAALRPGILLLTAVLDRFGLKDRFAS